MMCIKRGLVYFLFLMLVFIQNDSYADTYTSELNQTKGQIHTTLTDIEAQIKVLQKQKKELQRVAKYLDREAYRIQFIDFAYYKELLARETRCKERIAALDVQIALLQKDKERLQSSLK